MRFIVVLATIFSACCCFSVLNIFFFDPSGQKSYMFNRRERALLINTLTDEEILRCRNFTDKLIKDLNQRPTQEQIQDILSLCNLFLQQNSELFASKDENNSTLLLPFETRRSQEYDFIIEEYSSIENYEEVNGKTGRANEIPSADYERRENDGNSPLESLSNKNEDLRKMSTDRILKPTTESSGLGSFIFGSKGLEEAEATSEYLNDHGNLKMMPTAMNPKPTAKRSGLWSLHFWSKGSSDNSSAVPVTKQNDDNSADTRNSKTELNNVILSWTNTSWSRWNYLFHVSDSSKSSNENRSLEDLKRSTITESRIYFENSTDSEYLKTEIQSVWNIVMPGTKWCGSGSIAANDDDLGYFKDVDRCCRAHDQCNDMMAPGESKYNLTNTSPFTVLNCKCDDELHDCLSQINSVAANTVGNTFFNILSRMCYILDYPRKCKKYYTLLGCQEYEIDKTAGKVYQWKPAKKYLKIMPFTISGR